MHEMIFKTKCMVTGSTSTAGVHKFNNIYLGKHEIFECLKSTYGENSIVPTTQKSQIYYTWEKVTNV